MNGDITPCASRDGRRGVCGAVGSRASAVPGAGYRACAVPDYADARQQLRTMPMNAGSPRRIRLASAGAPRPQPTRSRGAAAAGARAEQCANRRQAGHQLPHRQSPFDFHLQQAQRQFAPRREPLCPRAPPLLTSDLAIWDYGGAGRQIANPPDAPRPAIRYTVGTRSTF